MSYLSREAATLSGALWGQIDSAVIQSARSSLTGRRFLSIFGPLGIGTGYVPVDDAEALAQADTDGIMTTTGRKYVEIPTLYTDFTLHAKDIEGAAKAGYPLDLSNVMAAAEQAALKEDGFIYFGNKRLGYEGLLTASGANKLEMKDWGVGENAFSDVASAISLLVEQGIYGAYALVVSPDVYVKMQRLQPGTGLLEIDRVSKLVDGHIIKAPALGKGKAFVVCPNKRNMDLAIGQDMATAYLEQKELNHVFRLLETVLLRIKRAKAIVVFE